MWRLQALGRDLKLKPEVSCDEVGYVQSVNDSRNITKNCQQDVDQKVGTATTLPGKCQPVSLRGIEGFFAHLKEDTKRREDDGKNDLADIAGNQSVSMMEMACASKLNLPCGERHLAGLYL